MVTVHGAYLLGLVGFFKFELMRLFVVVEFVFQCGQFSLFEIEQFTKILPFDNEQREKRTRSTIDGLAEHRLLERCVCRRPTIVDERHRLVHVRADESSIARHDNPLSIGRISNDYEFRSCAIFNIDDNNNETNVGRTCAERICTFRFRSSIRSFLRFDCSSPVECV
jgi:hypothetical protein